MTAAKREWERELCRVDNGYYATTPFFISFIDRPETLRRAQYLYLLGLVALFAGQEEKAARMFEESYALNSDNLFCGHYARAF